MLANWGDELQDCHLLPHQAVLLEESLGKLIGDHIEALWDHHWQTVERGAKQLQQKNKLDWSGMAS